MTERNQEQDRHDEANHKKSDSASKGKSKNSSASMENDKEGLAGKGGKIEPSTSRRGENPGPQNGDSFRNDEESGTTI